MVIEQQPSSANTKTIVIGLGVTGLSCVRYLRSQGEDVAVSDNRELPPGLEELQRQHPDTPVFLGPFDRDLFVSADRLVVSPGVPIATPEIAAAASAGVEVIGDIELFARQVNAPVIAITGSNGKSTVTTLVGEMAKQSGMRVAVGGNLGKPALDLLEDDVELFVLELSSFQLETTESLRAAVATVLNVSPDHMDRYPSLEDYATTKAKILVNAGVGVFNLDDPLVVAMGGVDDRWSFTLGRSTDDKVFGVTNSEGRDCLARGEEPLMSVDELLMPGRHNRANALAALAIGTASGFKLQSMLEVLRTFRGLAHRTEFIIEHSDVRWYNDSKGTNVGATVAALQGLQSDGGGLTVLIAGGDCKGADFSPLGAILQGCARAVVLIGRDAEQISAFVPATVPVERAETLDEAVVAAARLAQPSDRVLLSPACASFDMFEDYVQRGNHFVQAVQRWAA